MKLAVPDLISNSYFPAVAAVALGFFEEEGLEVSLELIFPVDEAYRAMRDGRVDFVAGSAHSARATHAAPAPLPVGGDLSATQWNQLITHIAALPAPKVAVKPSASAIRDPKLP